MKEDAQEFGVLAEQKVPLYDALKYPVTKLPLTLSIAESETDLRGASSDSKSKFRNHILNKTNSVSYVHPKSAVWVYDVGRFIRSLPPESTYRLFFDRILKKMTPPKDADPLAVHLLIDKYIEDSTKSGARTAPSDYTSQASVRQC